MMKCETQPFDIEASIRQDCYNRGYEQGRKNPAEEIVAYIENLQKQVKEYQDKIEQGTLVSTEAYFIVEEDEWAGKNRFLICRNGVTLFVHDFCETREEAKKRLKELQNG